MAKLKRFNIHSIIMTSILIVLLLVILLATFTYAFWQKNIEQKNENTLSSGCFSYKLQENSSSIRLDNAYPMSEEEAIKNAPYSFTVTNNCSLDMNYIVTLNITNNNFPNQYIMYRLTDSKDNLISKAILNTVDKYAPYKNYTYKDENGSFNILSSFILDRSSLSKATMSNDNTTIVKVGESKSYKLYLWIDEDVTDMSIMGKTFEAKVIVTSGVKDPSIDNLEKI